MITEHIGLNKLCSGTQHGKCSRAVYIHGKEGNIVLLIGDDDDGYLTIGEAL